MPDVSGRAMLKLMAWLSPSFPVGSFSYSHGLERAVHDGVVADASDLEEWVGALLLRGSARNDAVLLAEAWRQARSGGSLDAVAELGIALAGSAERLLESEGQGGAFAAAMSAAGGAVVLPEPCPYCVAVGAAAGHAALPLETALAAFLQAFVSNQLQAAIRLGVIGQTKAVAMLSLLEDAIAAAASAAARSTLDDLGSAAFHAEIAAMRHETQYSRLFRS